MRCVRCHQGCAQRVRIRTNDLNFFFRVHLTCLVADESMDVLPGAEASERQFARAGVLVEPATAAPGVIS